MDKLEFTTSSTRGTLLAQCSTRVIRVHEDNGTVFMLDE